jgi:hypothetical protein
MTTNNLNKILSKTKHQTTPSHANIVLQSSTTQALMNKNLQQLIHS